MAATENYNACADLLDRNVAEGRGDKLAYIDPERSVTYSALLEQTGRVGALLHRLGLEREDRVLMIMLDGVDWPAVFLGAIRAGVIPVPVNTMLGAEQYSYMLADSRAKALFVSNALLPSVQPALAGASHLQNVIVADADDTATTIGLTKALAAETPNFDIAPTHPDETAFWLYSSGSTGNPKGARHVHTSMMATATTYAKNTLGIREDDVVYSAAKLFFAYGLGNALSFPLSVGATTFLFPGRPTPAAVFDILEARKPSIFCGVPTLFAAMLHDRACIERRGSPKLRVCASAGEALPEHIGSQFAKRFGADILDGVGSTEMLHIFLSNAPGDIVYGTSGKAVPGYELRLLDEALKPIAEGEVGELYVKGPSSADGYWNQRDKSRATFQGDWTRTGDKYTCDANGRYTYCGRADDMFKVSGIWVSPFEVEAALATHPAVLEAAVVPGEDDDGLLKPKAFVVLKEGASGDGLEESLKEHVKASVGMWKYPRRIRVVESLPKTATGKIQRFKLRDGTW
jgi:4-hydroxybenzoate-CoA ligase